MAALSVTEARASLNAPVERALVGEVISIGRHGRLGVVLVAAGSDIRPRPLGTWRTDEDHWMAEDFDAPLPEVEAAFDGRPG